MIGGHPPATRVPTRHLAWAAALVLAATACSSSAAVGDPRNGVPPATPVASPGTASPGGVDPGTAPPTAAELPLTGLPAASAELAARPIVAVAVETATGSSPATGVAAADVVYLTFPAGGRQRGLALFQSRDDDRVGPVADTRPLDSKLLRALGAVLEHSGGTSGFVKQVDRADLPEWSSLVHPSSFARDPAGTLFGSTAAARGADGVQPARPGLFAYAPAPAATAAPPPVRVQVPGQDLTTLTWDAATSTWRGAAGGWPVMATNIVVQQVTYPPLVLPKTGGRTEGNPDPDGQGPATLLSGTRVDQGTWNRPGGGTSTKYVQQDGTPARLVPGSTWVLLVPPGTTVQTS